MYRPVHAIEVRIWGKTVGAVALDPKPRTGRNPQTGKEIKIPARKAVSFAVGKSLKEAVQAPAKKVTNKK